MGSGCVGIAMHLSSLFFRNSVSFGKRIIGGHVEGNGLLVVGSTLHGHVEGGVQSFASTCIWTQVYFHDNAGVVIDPAIFADKKDFVALTFTGDRLTSFCPPP